MTKILLEAILRIIIIIPFAILFLRERNRINFVRILTFALCYIAYELAIVLPRYCSCFDIIKSSWNWDGKIYGLIIGIVCYFAFKKLFIENNFLTIKQNTIGFKSALLASIIIICLLTIIWFILGNSKFDIETLAFQISIPGLDEEIMYRGILLELLASALKEKVILLGNPSILLTAILFGLMHALNIDKINSIKFDMIYFV